MGQFKYIKFQTLDQNVKTGNKNDLHTQCSGANIRYNT